MGRQQIYDEAEQEYLEILRKVERRGNATFIVDEEGENEEYFEKFNDAVKYAKRIGADKIIADEFEYCYGYYCDGEYVEYGRVILDLDKNIIDWE